ncbi:putative FG-GAP repeat protein, putative,intergrin alpha chain [Sesbania bispinosa]|nr:putative FG-GAP repeat protein, putative,intergrin alpha chain [Sesbania bispinosa]
MEPNQPELANSCYEVSLRANKDYIKIPATFFRNFGNQLVGTIVILQHQSTGNCFTSTVDICHGKPYFIGGIENIRHYNPRPGKNPSRRHSPIASFAPWIVRAQRTKNVHSDSCGAPNVGTSPRTAFKITPYSTTRVGSSSLGAPEVIHGENVANAGIIYPELSQYMQSNEEYIGDNHVISPSVHPQVPHQVNSPGCTFCCMEKGVSYQSKNFRCYVT